MSSLLSRTCGAADGLARSNRETSAHRVRLARRHPAGLRDRRLRAVAGEAREFALPTNTGARIGIVCTLGGRPLSSAHRGASEGPATRGCRTIWKKIAIWRPSTIGAEGGTRTQGSCERQSLNTLRLGSVTHVESLRRVRAGPCPWTSFVGTASLSEASRR